LRAGRRLARELSAFARCWSVALRHILGCMGSTWPGTPTKKQIQNAPEHIAWEYVALLAAAQQMGEGHGPPINHQVQEAFLVHLRNLAEFFHQGVVEFRKNPAVLPCRKRDNIYAVDLCSSVSWHETLFDPKTRLRRAIDKTLSHMTYSRDLSSGSSEIDLAFDGRFHVHGTVTLIRRTWDAFLKSLRPEYQADLSSWLAKHAEGMRVSLGTFDDQFEKMARRWSHWRFNQTPDGPI
jgi:hypothetical protein